MDPWLAGAGAGNDAATGHVRDRKLGNSVNVAGQPIKVPNEAAQERGALVALAIERVDPQLRPAASLIVGTDLAACSMSAVPAIATK